MSEDRIWDDVGFARDDRIPCRSHRQSGLGLVELMVVMVIAILMLFGLFSIQYGTRQNYLAQNQLSQMEDGQRIAVTDLANVVQEGGYFPDPTVEAVDTALPAVTPFAIAGQGVYGISGASPGNDVLYVRYKTAPTDGVMDCTGATNVGGANEIVVNEFSVLNNQMVCTVSDNGATTTYPLVNNVTGMTVEYGIDTNGDGSADEYMAASAITAANWSNVVSVKVVLTFTNPFAHTTSVGTSSATTGILTLTRTIALLSRYGTAVSGGSTPPSTPSTTGDVTDN